MRLIIKCVAVLLAVTALWFLIWHALMADDVARVEATMAHHNQRLRETNRNVSLRADAISAAGFPFAFRVRVEQFALSMVDGDETFAVSIPELTMALSDRGQGVYRVNLPASVDALYAKNGAAPEYYKATADVVPKLNLSAADAKQPCGPLVGKACVDVAADAPLISFALGLPKTITLRMALADETRDARFEFPAIAVPIYQPIPPDPSRALQLFIGVLREALVFHTRGNEI